MGTTITEATQWTAKLSKPITVEMYHQHHGPLTRVDIVFVAMAISQVSQFVSFAVFIYYFNCISFSIRLSGHKVAVN